MNEHLEQLKAKREALNKEIQDNGKDLIRKGLEEIFAKYPLVQNIAWTQYAPYFNDGEPCVFSVNDDPIINGYSADWGEIRFPENSSPEDEEFLKENGYKAMTEKYKDVNDDVFRFLNDAVKAMGDGAFKQIFTDDGMVTVYRDGRVDVGEYDHD